MKRNKNSMALFLVFILCLQVWLQYPLEVSASTDGSTQPIPINNELDFLKLARKATIDSYSKGKVFILENDLDFTNYNYKPIPIFAGILDGNGKTIKGINIDSPGSNLGLIRFVEETGEVRNLNIVANVTPSGSQINIGALVGTNNGRITNCSFEGTVKGINTVGGLVGLNDEKGYISGSSSKGEVSADTITGGLVGSNKGIIIKSSNYAKVNTSSKDPDIKIQNLPGDILEEDKEINPHTDTGGLVGFSQGIIQSSTNYGSVGYPHVGYNVGGIAGRQSGYMKSCENYGTVYGRKDVGGIVGQMEPYLQVEFSKDPLQKMDTELTTLKNMMNSSLDSFDASAQSTSDQLGKIRGLTDNASTELHNMIDATSDFADETTKQLNEVSLRFSSFLDDAEPALDGLSLASKKMTEGLDSISDAFGNFEDASDEAGVMADKLRKSFNKLTDATRELDDAMDTISDALVRLSTDLGDPAKTKEAINDLKRGFDELQKASDVMSELFDVIENLIRDMKNLLFVDWDSYADQLGKIGDDFTEIMNNSFPLINDSLDTLLGVVGDDVEVIKKTLPLLAHAFDYFEAAASDLDAFSRYLSQSMTSLEKVTEFTSEASSNLEKGTDHLSLASELFGASIDKIDVAVENLQSKPDIVLPELGQNLNEPTDKFFDTFDQITDEMDSLSTIANSSRKDVVNDLKTINNQMSKILDIIMEAHDEALNGIELYEDISEETLTEKEDEVILGHVTKAKNAGKVEGDINVGGISGSMAIDYDFDPESDVMNTEKTSLKFRYKTRSVLVSSVNTGDVIAKKNYSGGITGKMDVGLIYNAENYAPVTSTDGDYVGGIAGYSSSTIKKTYAKSDISGNRYVGGIAGLGENIIDSYSLIRVQKGTENIGSISGDIHGDYTNNYYLESDLGAIDNISYAGKAEPMTFDAMMAVETLPKKFSTFQLIFKTEDEVIKTIDFKYGDTLAKEDIPAVPEKEGFNGVWPDYDFSHLIFSDTLVAEYTPYITTIASQQKTENEKPVFLVEGIFNASTSLSATVDQTLADNFDSKENILGTYHITLQNANKEASSYNYRYYSPDEKNIKMYYKVGDDYKEGDIGVDGSYITFTIDANEFDIVFVKAPMSIPMTYILLGTLILLGILAIIIYKVKKKKKALPQKEKQIES